MSEQTPAESEGTAIPWLHMHANPYNIPLGLSEATARVVIEWGRFEHGLSTDLSQLRQYPNVRALAFDEPRSFKKLIELWKRSIDELFPEVIIYRKLAAEICSKGKTIAHHRHRLIHGIWLPSAEQNPINFSVLNVRGIDKVAKVDTFLAEERYVKAVATDINSVSNLLFEFIANRGWHSGIGLLTAKIEPAP